MVSRDEGSIILDIMLSLHRRSCQITDLGGSRADSTDYRIKSRISLCQRAEQSTKKGSAHYAAYGTFDGFLRAQHRRQLVFANEHTGAVGTGITAPGA